MITVQTGICGINNNKGTVNQRYGREILGNLSAGGRTGRISNQPACAYTPDTSVNPLIDLNRTAVIACQPVVALIVQGIVGGGASIADHLIRSHAIVISDLNIIAYTGVRGRKRISTGDMVCGIGNNQLSFNTVLAGVNTSDIYFTIGLIVDIDVAETIYHPQFAAGGAHNLTGQLHIAAFDSDRFDLNPVGCRIVIGINIRVSRNQTPQAGIGTVVIFSVVCIHYAVQAAVQNQITIRTAALHQSVDIKQPGGDNDVVAGNNTIVSCRSCNVVYSALVCDDVSITAVLLGQFLPGGGH